MVIEHNHSRGNNEDAKLWKEMKKKIDIIKVKYIWSNNVEWKVKIDLMNIWEWKEHLKG